MTVTCEYCQSPCKTGLLKCPNCSAPLGATPVPGVDYRHCPYCRRMLLALGSPACNYCGRRLPEEYIKAREGDLQRLTRYSRALESGLQFVLTLQYTEARTQHFVEGFRPAIVGAFHASGQDGKIRVDFTQHTVSALVRHLEE